LGWVWSWWGLPIGQAKQHDTERGFKPSAKQTKFKTQPILPHLFICIYKFKASKQSLMGKTNHE